MAQISVRVDDKVKAEAAKTLEEIGLNMNTAINVFLKAVAREHRIPFELTAESPAELTWKTIEDGEKGIGVNGPFDTVEDMMRSLHA